MSAKKNRQKASPPKWQICTEGVTEANYLDKYIQALGLGNYVIVNCRRFKTSGCGKQHEALLDKMQECGRNWNVERVFLVHDYDKAAEHSGVKNSFDKTFSRARKESDYKVIYSNPCFEYWLMLHIGYFDSDLHRHEYQEKTKQICNRKREESGLSRLHDYEYKNDDMLFEYFGGMDGSRVACSHALARFKEDKKSKKEGSFSSERYAKNAPCTNFFELLDALNAYAALLNKHLS